MYKQIATLTLLTTTLIPTLAFAQGNETKQLNSFTSINITGKGKVILRQDTSHTIRTEPSDKREDVKATVNGNTLSIDAPEDATLYISMKQIEALSIGGTGSITSEAPIKSEKLKLSVGGSGKIDLSEVDAKDIDADISGLGKMTLAGKAENVNAKISGSGKIDAERLKTTNCKAEISGVGKCTIDVTDNLDVSISGSGKVNFVNPPKNLSKNISGVGRVRGAGGEGGDSTMIRLGNKKIVLSDDDDDDGDDDKDKEGFGKSWEKSFGKNFPFNEKKKKSSNKNRPSWPGIELGINGYMDADNSTTLPQGLNYLDLDYGKSMSFSINFFDVRKKFFSRHLFLFTGLGLTWNNYRFSNNITLNPNSSTVLATSDSISYSKNKLTASYLVAPAMVEVFFGNNRKKSFHLAGGMMLGYNLASHTKQKYESDGKTVKTKVFDDFNLNPFRASVRVAAGYGSVSVFAEQALTTLFEKDKGPVLYPFTAGIGLSIF